MSSPRCRATVDAPTVGLIAHVDTTPGRVGRRTSQPPVVTRLRRRRRSCSRATRPRCSIRTSSPELATLRRPRHRHERRDDAARRRRQGRRRRDHGGRRVPRPRRLGLRARPSLALHGRRGDRPAATTHLDLEQFGADVAYTLDGSGSGRARDRDLLGQRGHGHDPRPQRPSGHGEGQAREQRQARGGPRGGAAPRPAFAGDDRGPRGIRAPDADRRHRRTRRDRRSSCATTTTPSSRSTSRSCAGWSTTWPRASRARGSTWRSRHLLEHAAVIEAAPARGRGRGGGDPPGRRRAERRLIRGGTDGARLVGAGPADAEPLHGRPELPLRQGVGERPGHGGRGRDGRRAREGVGGGAELDPVSD